MQVRGDVKRLWTIAVTICAILVCCPGCVSKTMYTQSQNDLTDCREQLQSQKQTAAVSTTFFDGLVAAMEDEIATNQLTIQQMKDGVRVNLPAGVLFGSGSATVKEKGQEILKKVAQELKDVPYQTVVAGYTDNVRIGGNLSKIYPSNWDLAAARASDVVRLLQEGGVPADRLLVVSFGENNPVASNDTAEGRAQNRRIEIRLRPVAILK